MKLIDSSDVPINFGPQQHNPQAIELDKTLLDRKDLLSGDSKKIESHITEGPNLIATIRTISDTHLKDGEPDTFTVIDLRGVPIVDGLREFDGNKFGPDIEYLLIDPSQLDWQTDRGYKGIRRGESIKMGRYVEPTEFEMLHMSPEEKKSLAIKRDRFPGLSAWTSRNHFSLVCDENGDLLVSDLKSSNGTTVAEGDAAINLIAEEEHRKKVEDIIRPIGEVALESEAQRTPHTAESKLIVPNLDIAEAKKLAAEITGNRNPEINKEIISNYAELEPKYEIDLDGRKYYFSSIIDMGGRLNAVAFVDVDGKFMPRLFYKSNSEGGWRSCPGMEGNRYSKGEHENDGAYVQVTKPVEELTQKLEVLASDSKSIIPIAPHRIRPMLSVFDVDRDGMDEVNTFEEEVTIAKIDERWARGVYDSYEPGIGFKYGAEKSRATLESMELPPGFEPDFTNTPKRRYSITHTIAGLTEVSVYSSTFQNRPIEWHMARSESGNVWVESIRFTDVESTSYGTPTEVIIAGALSAKPFEYGSCVENMAIDEDYEWVDGKHGGTYVNLQKTWDRMPPIKRFKKALGLGVL